VNNYIIEYKEQYAHEKYCPYCVTPKSKKLTCCGEAHWVNFEDLDDNTQLTIIKEEYDNAFKD
jgi:sarcosine oxidase delta subunit